MSIFLDLLLIIVGSIFSIMSYKNLIYKKNGSVANYIILIIYVFCILPILLNYVKNKKIPVTDWLAMMGRTKHLAKAEYASIAAEIQAEVDRRFERLKARANHPLL